MMLMVQDGTAVINTQQVEALYTTQDKRALRVELTNGKPWNVGRYGSTEEALAAVQIIFKQMSTGRETVQVPDDDTVRAFIVQNKQAYHHATGKKTKGHGGS